MAAKASAPAVILLAALFSAGISFAETRLTLAQANERVPPDLRPAREGELISVQGTVSTRPVPVLGLLVLPIQDDAGNGLLLEGEDRLLSALQPGDLIEVLGALINRAGAPTLRPTSVRRIRQVPPPSPRAVTVKELLALKHLGVLVTIESPVVSIGENAGGETAQIGEQQQLVKLFLPRRHGHNLQSHKQFSINDRVKAVGIASQYCPTPPYDCGLEVILPNPESIVAVQHSWIVPPYALLLSLIGVSVLAMLWWIRERRLGSQRRDMKSLHALGEEIVGAGSPTQISQKLTAMLPRIFGVNGVHLYLYQSQPPGLERVTSSERPGAARVALDAPGPGVAQALVLCYRNRTLLHVPDTKSSPIFRPSPRKELPRSVLAIPMFAHTDLLGVLLLESTPKPKRFRSDEQTALQHLGNQVATALRLQEQQSMREQLFRSEKLAAAGRLISGIAGELQSPLDAISRVTSRLLIDPSAAVPERDLRMLSLEARRATDIVARLVALTSADRSEPLRVDLNPLLSGLADFRERDWITRGITVERRFAEQPVHVFASPGQIEQVFLNLLVHAEHSLTHAVEKRIIISTSLFAQRAIAAIGYTGWSAETTAADLFTEEERSDAGALGLGVCQEMVQSQGGEIRLIHDNPHFSRFEVELPAAPPVANEADAGADIPRSSRALTILLVEADAVAQRQIASLLSARGHRTVPVASAEDALELVDRLRFDVLFCAVRLPGQSWIELLNVVRYRVGLFVLLAEAYDQDLARVVQNSDGYFSVKPTDGPSMVKLMDVVEGRLDQAAAAKSHR